MKKKLLWIIILFVMAFVYKTDVYAFDVSNYQDKGLCGAFEEVGMHSDGEMVTVGCFGTYEEAKADMTARGNNDLVIMTAVNGKTAIIDANMALLDLTVNPNTLTYYYTNQELKGSSFTYMDNGSLYGGVDGVHMATAYSSYANSWVAKVQIGNCEGWIPKEAYEIVPITWVRAVNAYVISNEDIRHIYVSKVQELYTGNSGRTIGPKPEMLNPGTYYSFDGHYFYRDLETLIPDVKNGNRNHAVNKDKPYYNYYMYLSNHTKTNYSSINIDEYIRNNMGYHENAYGTSAAAGTSRLYGSGTFFYHAQEKHGVNAVLSLSLSRNETGNGRSYLAVNKNNGFGLNAVDSNPINGATWYASFSSSILGYASKWITNGYAHPRDWRYYGPQFGDKGSGMNVKYASDTFWSEKMASNYYSLDKAFGMQDYNTYQLGVVNGPSHAYISPNDSSKIVYTYPEREDGVVIVGEQNGYYKVMSDINIDNNGNEKSGDYNWHGYVYVKTGDIRKINTSKNGYMNPNNIFEYEDASYQYDLYIQDTILKPKTAITTKNTSYYYDSTLSSKTGKTLLKDRYVMVYTTAYKNGMPVAYLVTSDYFHDQKHWVSADSIRFVSMHYGKVTVDVEGNQYTWVNYNMEDESYSIISGLYTYTYVPIFEIIQKDGNTWMKVPVNLTGNDNISGYTLAKAPGVVIEEYAFETGDNKPVITAKDKTIVEGDNFNPKEGVTATDPEDGDLTSKIEVMENTVNTTTPGEYKVTYRAVDSNNNIGTLTIKVTVKENKAPVINAEDKVIHVGDTFNPKENVTATDAEDGNLNGYIKVKTNTVDSSKVGTYKVIYEVSDSRGKTTTKEIKVEVKEKVEINPDEIDLEDLENLEEKESIFYFDYLKEVNHKLQIKGYNVIRGINNTLDKEITPVLVFESLNDDEFYVEVIERITNKNEITRPVNSNDPQDYTYSWFKGDIDLENIPNGDYRIYIVSLHEDGYYSISLISNKVLRTQVAAFNGEKYVTTRNNYLNNDIPIELIIRSEKIGEKTATSMYNMYNQYRTLEFKNHKLHIKGTAYSYGMDLSASASVERKIIFENTDTYEQYRYDLGSTTNGLYQVGTTLGDNLGKERAWFDQEIDLSNLPKGNYAIYISNSSNIKDFGELNEILGRNVSNIKDTNNNKEYSFEVNSDNRYRIELNVE